MNEQTDIENIATAKIGDKYAAFRLVVPRLDEAMVKSLRKYGQMTPVVCTRTEDGYELIDGFKRLRASRRINKELLTARVFEARERVCKAAIIQLNVSGWSISEMEEAMVLQSLHRDDCLTQIEIAALVGRHKSWVSRRLSLIERLNEEVQDDIKLGLLSAVMGRELARLPRGNQKRAAEAVLKHRLSTREAAKLITHILGRPRWEYEAILRSPWETVEPKQPRPMGLEAKLIAMQHICFSASEKFSKSSAEERGSLSILIDKVIISAEKAVCTFRAGL